jgi:hypothetical protein
LTRRAKHRQNGIVEMNLDRARGGAAGFLLGVDGGSSCPDGHDVQWDVVMGEDRAVSIAKRPRARKRRFYEMGPDYGVGGKAGYWLEDESILPPYKVFRLPASTAPAPFVFDKSAGSLPIELEPYYGWWIHFGSDKNSIGAA